jgi:hypothetical protein
MTPFGCSRARRAMPLRYYAALPGADREWLDRHLAACPACASDWEALRLALDAAIPSTVFPMEAEVDWDRQARDTVARARTAAAAAREGDFAVPLPGAVRRPYVTLAPAAARWAALAAAVLVAVLLVTGWPGRRAPGPGDVSSLQGPGDQPTAESVRESAALIETRLARRGATRYLTDSRVLLLNLVQAQARCRKADGEFDITFEKEKSRELLRRKNLHEGNLDTLRDRRLSDLVGQMESLLIQVTSLGDCASARQLHELREEIERRQILLRIDLFTREMQEKTHVV